jgi:hypothetical protein
VSAPELAIGHIVAGKYSIQSLLHHGGVTSPCRHRSQPRRRARLYDPRVKSFPDVMREMARTKPSSRPSRSSRHARRRARRRSGDETPYGDRPLREPSLQPIRGVSAISARMVTSSAAWAR